MRFTHSTIVGCWVAMYWKYTFFLCLRKRRLAKITLSSVLSVLLNLFFTSCFNLFHFAIKFRINNNFLVSHFLIAHVQFFLIFLFKLHFRSNSPSIQAFVLEILVHLVSNLVFVSGLNFFLALNNLNPSSLFLLSHLKRILLILMLTWNYVRVWVGVVCCASLRREAWNASFI